MAVIFVNHMTKKLPFGVKIADRMEKTAELLASFKKEEEENADTERNARSHIKDSKGR